jgi:aromatic ring-cleaving dioxygenase
MKLYHAHVYFKSFGLRAQDFYLEASNVFKEIKLYPKPVGPHPLPMVELHFVEKEPATKWLKDNHGDFSVLIHEETGDDVRDHTENIEWLGTPLVLDFNFFELIKTRPDLKVHSA